MTGINPDSSQGLMARRQRVMGPAYRHFYRKPVHLVRGEGVWLFDSDGQRYLDCYNNVASVGHCHPHVVDALSRQAATLNTHTRYLHENVVELAERLGRTLPGDLEVCLFVCTGTEANDLALRIARAVSGNHGVIVTEHAYHGNSTAVFELSTEEYPVADQPDYLQQVTAPRSGEIPAAIRSVEQALATLDHRGHGTAMFICDNIFSSNGVLTPPPDYLRSVYRTVRAAGGLVVADEVQSGLCRLGENWWAFMDSGVVPDIVTMGKPMGDGHPLAVVVTTPRIAQAFAQKYHYFNTFGGNPVSAAVGLAVLDVIEQESILQHVATVGAYLRSGLDDLAARHDTITDVRGKGLFYGIDLDAEDGPKAASQRALDVREILRNTGVLLSVTGPENRTLKIRPPLVFARKHADELLCKLDEALCST